MTKIVMFLGVVAGMIAVPAVAQSRQVTEMRYRAELARERSQQQFYQQQERMRAQQQMNQLRQAELRARTEARRR